MSDRDLAGTILVRHLFRNLIVVQRASEGECIVLDRCMIPE